MSLFKKLAAIPSMQKYRYFWIMLSCTLLVSPVAIIPALLDNPDLCGKLCMRRFYLFFPGMTWDDFLQHASVAFIGVIALLVILATTFFFGRIWCSFLCPMGGFPELVSRLLPDRWKIEYRALPQVPIRYSYFAVYLVLMPLLGVSACVLCNFITVPRFFEALSGGLIGIAFIFSTVGLVNLALLFLLGFFANKGRAYCQFLCPIGALDGLVNRLGARFRFTHRIRVERDRCSGCNKCARQCMTGAITMVDRIAVVDQLSCMSCNECADVCEWDAIKWTTAPSLEMPKRVKKNVQIHPQPVWQSVYIPPGKSSEQWWKRIQWGRLFFGLMLSTVITLVSVGQLMAAPRATDPDGCLSCHEIAGLDYIDAKGVVRSASIQSEHYLGSLHGSVPCKDCHQKVSLYPHKEENTAVDCNAACHVEEPSKGEAYSHKPVHKEFSQSIHNAGASKGFTGSNRAEEQRSQAPSCRYCHQNTAYVPEAQVARFQETFEHTDQACGSCHQGEVWRDQFAGHVLRRLIGARWHKSDEIVLCNSCHDNHDAMANVERSTTEDGKTVPATARFGQASQTYAMTLHARLIRSGVDEGPSCLECHAPEGLRHAVRGVDDPLSSTHPDRLDKTCAGANCHAYAAHQWNRAFLHTDLHNTDQLDVGRFQTGQWQQWLDSNWARTLIAGAPVIALLALGSLWWLIPRRQRKNPSPVVGHTLFESRMLGVKRKRKTRKHSKTEPKAPVTRRSTTDTASPAANVDGENTP